MKKVSNRNLPDKEVIAYDKDGYTMTGSLTRNSDGSVTCEKAGYEVDHIVSYETLAEAKARVKACLNP